MLNHYQQESNHCIALGISDLSFWCYQCDSYINHLTIKRVFEMYKICHFSKFKEKVPQDLTKQYGEYEDEDEDEDEYEYKYELYINMELELKQIKLKMTHNNNNSLVMIDKLIGTFNNETNTYLYFDDNMILHQCNKQSHENPDRIIDSIQLLANLDLLNKCIVKNSEFCIEDQKENEPSLIDPNLTKLEEKYKNTMDDLNQKSIDEIKYFDHITYFNKYSYFAAKSAYLSCYDLFCNLLLNKDKNYGFALIRPPGHHCNYSHPMGFCLNNNVSIGINALRANQKCNKDSKFMIIDWDIHHGNGTQEIFYNDPNVVYISIHEGVRQFDINGMKGVSKTKHGLLTDIGGPHFDSYGKNINIPLDIYSNYTHKGYGDKEYLLILKKIIVPVLKEFDPDLCIISSGFDACIGDKMGGFQVSPIGYGLMVRLLINNCQSNNIAMVLEGGYNLCTMPRSIGCCIYSLLKGKTAQNLTLSEYETEFKNTLTQSQQTSFDQWRLFQSNISTQHHENTIKETGNVIEKVIRIHSKYWESLSK